jgi:hypothetical protein
LSATLQKEQIASGLLLFIKSYAAKETGELIFWFPGFKKPVRPDTKFDSSGSQSNRTGFEIFKVFVNILTLLFAIHLMIIKHITFRYWPADNEDNQNNQ